MKNFPYRHVMLVGTMLAMIALASGEPFNGLDILAMVVMLGITFIWVQLQFRSEGKKERERWQR